MTAPVIWNKGAFINSDNASIPITDRGFLLGDGIFDTMAAHDGVFQHAKEHMARLFENAEVMHFDLPYTQDEMLNTAKELLTHNGLLTGHISVRTTITRGTGPRGLAPAKNPDLTIIMTATPFDPSLFAAPAKLIIAKSVRRNEGSALSRIKSLNYGDNILAKLEADEAGADDALMMNNKGHIACGTNCNLFIIKGGRWFTPPIEDGVLAGITRADIMSAHNVTEQSLSKGHIMAADQAFISNSIIGLRPVAAIDTKNF